MSKLSTSLRDSISAEKQSVAKNHLQPDDATVYDSFTKHEIIAQTEALTHNLTQDESALFESLKKTLLAKNTPALHHYEMLWTLFELNLINKNADFITNSTHQALAQLNDLMQMTVDGMDEITRNNLDAIRVMFENTVAALNSFSSMRYPPYWLQLSSSTTSI